LWREGDFPFLIPTRLFIIFVNEVPQNPKPINTHNECCKFIYGRIRDYNIPAPAITTMTTTKRPQHTLNFKIIATKTSLIPTTINPTTTTTTKKEKIINKPSIVPTLMPSILRPLPMKPTFYSPFHYYKPISTIKSNTSEEKEIHTTTIIAQTNTEKPSTKPTYYVPFVHNPLDDVKPTIKPSSIIPKNSEKLISTIFTTFELLDKSSITTPTPTNLHLPTVSSKVLLLNL
jgi:hypothetical protein